MADDNDSNPDPLNTGGGSTAVAEPPTAEQEKPVEDPGLPVSSDAPKAIGIRDPQGHPYDNPDAYINERARVYDETNKGIDQAQSYLKPAQERYMRMLEEDRDRQAQGPPKPMPAPPTPNVPPPEPRRGGGDEGDGWFQVGRALGKGLAGLFHSSIPQLTTRGQYARQNGMTPLGYASAATKSLNNGYVGSAVQQWQEYKLAVDQVNAYNEMVDKKYHESLANDNLALEDQAKLIKLVAQMTLDPVMLKAANAKDLPGIIKNLETMQASRNKFLQAQDKFDHTFQDAFLKKGEGEDYAIAVKQKSGGKIDLWNRDKGAFDKNIMEANKILPYDEWEKNRKSKTTTKTSEDTTAGVTSKKTETTVETPGAAPTQQKNNDPLGIRGGGSTPRQKNIDVNSYMDQGD